MTSPETPDGQGQVRDFTRPREPHRFRIDPDDFAAPAIISSVTLRKLSTLHGQLGGLAGAPGATPDENQVDALIKAMADMMRLMIPGAGGRRFAERLLSDGYPGDPDEGVPASPPVIDLMTEAMPVLYWLLECYGMRPTEPSSPLLNGSTDGSTNGQSGITSSTDTASPEASISAS